VTGGKGGRAMSDRFYSVALGVGGTVFRISGRPVVIGDKLVPKAGPMILAATHTSPYDVPLLMLHTPRRLDFVSIVEVFRNRPVGWLYGRMNAFPLDRSAPDAPTVRIILKRLRAGRAVAMFPEGGLRRGENSALHTRRIRPGIGRLARLAGAPVVPCVVVGSDAYARVGAWLPLRRTRYAVVYGAPIAPCEDAGELEQKLVDSWVQLHGAAAPE